MEKNKFAEILQQYDNIEDLKCFLNINKMAFLEENKQLID